MQTNGTTDQRLDKVGVRLSNLEEELATVKEDLTATRIEINDRFDQMEEDQGKKLDKILEVVLHKEKNVGDRLTHLEHHRVHPPIVQ